LIEAWASQKSFRAKDGGDTHPAGTVANKHSAIEGNSQYISNLVFTMERIYLFTALLIGVALVIASWLLRP